MKKLTTLFTITALAFAGAACRNDKKPAPAAEPPAATKPVDEAKPADTKPADTKPADLQPTADTKIEPANPPAPSPSPAPTEPAPAAK